MAGDDPLPGVIHGIQGWRKGCRCFTCRRGKADDQAKYRERVRAGATKMKTPNEKSGGSTMELLTRTEIMSFGVLSDEAEGLAHIAIVTGKLVDQIQKQGTWHLLNSTTKRYQEVMKDLRAIVRHEAGMGGEEGDDLLGSVGRFGDSGT